MMKTPILRILGKSNSGKTTFIRKLIETFSNIKVGVLKHTSHILKTPNNDKDTARHLAAGAKMVAGLSSNNGELFFNTSSLLNFNELIEIISKKTDLIIVEGAREYDLKTILLGEAPEKSLISDIFLHLEEKPNLTDSIIEQIRKELKI